MSFIVKKIIHGNEYYYLNENRRVVGTGKVKTKTLAYLGKNKKEAERKAAAFIKDTKKRKLHNDESKEKKDEKIHSEVKVGSKADEINSISSKRGFFFQTASIYGGKAGFFTYGHLGKALKTNWENLWRKSILNLDDNFYEIQSNSILPEKVFLASGHVENFNDPMVECKKCHFRFKADQFLEDKGVENADALSVEKMTQKVHDMGLKCPKCGGELIQCKQFNMMFLFNVGFNEEKALLS